MRDDLTAIPDWLRTYIDRAADALGLGHVTLCYRLKQLPRRRRGMGGDGQTHCVWQYNRVEITFDVALGPDAYGYATVTHELLHGSLMSIERAVDRIIDLVPPGQRPHALRLWQDGNEEAVERLARHLTPVLRAQREESSDGRETE